MLQINLSNIANGTMSRQQITQAIYDSIIDQFEPLEQLAILRELAKAAEDVEGMTVYEEGGQNHTIADMALSEAVEELSNIPESERTENGGGIFLYNGRMYKLSIRHEYDFSDASRYKGPYAADWRKQADIIAQCKKNSKLAKVNMNTDVKNYLNDSSVKHSPELCKPAETKISVSVL